jgi:hypothetical protein
MYPQSNKLNWKLAATVGTITGVAIGGFVMAAPDTSTPTPNGVFLEDIASVPRLSAPVVVPNIERTDPTPFGADFASPLSPRSAVPVPAAASPAPPAGPASAQSISSPASPLSVQSVASPASAVSVQSPASPASPMSPPSPVSVQSPASPASPVSPPSPVSVQSPASPASPVSPASPGSGASG